MRHRPRFPWTPEQRSRAHEMREAGQSHAQIAYALGDGCTESIVRHHFRRVREAAGVTSRFQRVRWRADQTARLAKLWDDGWSTIRIARQMNISKNAVIGKAHRLGLAKRESPIKRTGRLASVERLAEQAEPEAVVEAPAPQPELPPCGVEIAEAEPEEIRPWAAPKKSKPRCLWPGVQPVDPPDYAGCDARPVTGKPYCAEHCARAYSSRVSRTEAEAAQAGSKLGDHGWKMPI